MHWLDWVTIAARRGNAWFDGGWGESGDIVRRTSLLASRDAPPEVDVGWSDAWAVRGDAMVRHGAFDSPASHELPVWARRAPFEVLLPLTASSLEACSVCVLLTTPGEPGHASRRALAAPMVRDGVAVVLPSLAFDVDRNVALARAGLRTVADQLAQHHAAVLDTLALLTWLARQGVAQRAVCGVGLGGQLAALVAARSPEALAVVPFLAPVSCGSWRVDGAMSRAVRWSALTTPDTARHDAGPRLRATLDATSALRHPPPHRAEAAVIVGARRDGYAVPASVTALASHWPGAALRWVGGGHGAALRRGGDTLRDAVRAAMDGL